MKITVTTSKGKTCTRIQIKKSERMLRGKYLNTLGIDVDNPVYQSRCFLYYRYSGDLIEKYIGWDTVKSLCGSRIMQLKRHGKNSIVKIEFII